MPKIFYIEHDGTRHGVDAQNGKSVMQTALDQLVPGIIGDCGGNCACATCHGYIEEPWLARLPPATPDEKMMLEGAPSMRANSRLTCQVIVNEDLDGLVIHLPESQF